MVKRVDFSPGESGPISGGAGIGAVAHPVKAVVGGGNADKAQVHYMVQRLLPGAAIAGPDAADALAVAITHAHHLASARGGLTLRA